MENIEYPALRVSKTDYDTLKEGLVVDPWQEGVLRYVVDNEKCGKQTTVIPVLTDANVKLVGARDATALEFLHFLKEHTNSFADRDIFCFGTVTGSTIAAYSSLYPCIIDGVVHATSVMWPRPRPARVSCRLAIKMR